MASPFPGMDPYLEDPAVWPGLHNRLIVYGSDALQPLLLPGYYVEIRERVYFEQSRDVAYPDATLHRRRPAPVSTGSTPGAGQLGQPGGDRPAAPRLAGGRRAAGRAVDPPPF